MERWIDVKEKRSFLFEASDKECKDIEKKFELDDVHSVKGTFEFAPDDKIAPSWQLKGSVEAMVDGALIKEDVTIYVVDKEEHAENFDIYHDVEVINAKGQIDLGDIVGQYIYLKWEDEI